MGNLTKQVFTASGTWTAPNGVTQATIVSQYNPTSIQLQFGNSMGLTQNGALYGWGANTNGNLGINNTTAQSSPTQTVGNLTFSQISVGSDSTNTSAYGITQQGTSYAWGDNTNGQLGTGNVTAVSSPVAILGGLVFSQILTPNGNNNTANYAIGLTQGSTAYGWGNNTNGQLGTGNTTTVSSPVAVLGGFLFGKLFIDPDGGNATFGLTKNGTLYGWGANSNGQLGLGDRTPRSSPVAVLGGLTFQQVSTSDTSTLGLTSTGVAYGWGTNVNGQLGLGDVTKRSSPVAVLGGLTFQQLLTGAGYSFGLTTSGALYGWGLNSNGLLGVGDTTPRSSPVAVVGGLTFAQIFSNGATAWAVTTAGVMYGWGSNAHGEIGDGTVAAKSSPVAVLGGFTYTTTQPVMADTSVSVLAVTNNGQVYGWGANGTGQLGTNNTTTVSSPVAVVGGFTAAALPIRTTNQFTVVPNTGYTINIQPNPTFGMNQIGTLIPASVTVYFEE